MIKTLLAAALILPPTQLCAPVLAEDFTSPKPTPVVMSAWMGPGPGPSNPPAIAVSVVNIANNASCRSRARSKYFEMGARDLAPQDSNSQWGTIGSSQGLVWCRDNHAVISVAGPNFDTVVEFKDELKKAF